MSIVNATRRPSKDLWFKAKHMPIVLLCKSSLLFYISLSFTKQDLHEVFQKIAETVFALSCSLAKNVGKKVKKNMQSFSDG